MVDEAARPSSDGTARAAAFSSPPALFLLTICATAVVDLTLKAIARFERLPTVQFHVIHPSAAIWLFSLSALAVMIAVTARVPGRRPSWIYGGGVAWGGAIANMIELKTRGSVTNFIAVADRVACPADFAIAAGLSVWLGGFLMALVRFRSV